MSESTLVAVGILVPLALYAAYTVAGTLYAVFGKLRGAGVSPRTSGLLAGLTLGVVLTTCAWALLGYL